MFHACLGPDGRTVLCEDLIAAVGSQFAAVQDDLQAAVATAPVHGSLRALAEILNARKVADYPEGLQQWMGA